MPSMKGAMGMGKDTVRVYLRRITDYAAYDLEPIRYAHIDIEAPELAEILRREQQYPWHVVGVELAEE